ncbi:hypothetical protein EGR_10672 [Echinococcus granulosus]|uniref:Uncharacterized protein n=1 Tax=Echinococcus granulosus TaxID=6210 RepID=W6U0E4_ECHGR|nr:hypothetical protein EGR_10672 [Echinococcus granulosus]EUB54473.1 hypothetical protein EGR_10672 [Echinococcus granulosus]
MTLAMPFIQAAAITMNNLRDIRAQVNHSSDDGRKELHELLLRYANIFLWQGEKLGRKNIIKNMIDTGEARSIWPPRRLFPLPLLEEANRWVEAVKSQDTETVATKGPPPVGYEYEFFTVCNRLCFPYPYSTHPLIFIKLSFSFLFTIHFKPNPMPQSGINPNTNMTATVGVITVNLPVLCSCINIQIKIPIFNSL